MFQFSKYLSIEVILIIYLGIWNSTVPVIILKNGGAFDLTLYEMILSFTALVAMPVMAVKVERSVRNTVLQLGCSIIVLTGVLRYALLSNVYSLPLLVAVDVLSVCAFAALQPMFGIFPAETVTGDRVKQAFGWRKISSILARIEGPLVAAWALLYVVATDALMIAALIVAMALICCCMLPRYRVEPTHAYQTTRSRLSDTFLGVKLKGVLPPERALAVMNFALTLATASTIPMVIPAIIEDKNLPESSAGLFNSVFACGAIAGVFLSGRYLIIGERGRNTFIALWCALFIALSALTLISGTVSVVVALMMSGALISILSLVGVDRQALSIPARGRVRLGAATLMIGQLSSSIAFFMFGTLTYYFGLASLCLFYAGIFLSVVVFALTEKSLWTFLEDSQDAESFYERFYPELARRHLLRMK